eukprot:TRINITY_DN1578_c2_g1_i4.p1 TRINITY_DN1578_c2_g1~~TRINITY_DN1578_c2_g1_i4.p1  ORF type:complete len:319 (-),score=42.39 TRINITY_DN1578_c2_g1_i4:14-889(-)
MGLDSIAHVLLPSTNAEHPVFTAIRRRAMAAARTVLDPILAQYILEFLAPSLMIRCTCHTFRDATERHAAAPQKHVTLAAEAVASFSLIRWAVHIGLDPKLAHASCIRSGDFRAARLLYIVYGLPLQAEHAEQAARRGHLRLLQWLRQKGCPWGDDTCSSAAEGGHLELLQWTRANGCPWTAWTCAAAASGGHLGVLQWARANGCPWDSDTCSLAAAKGHLHVLQWARGQGCRWDTRTTTCAARDGHLETLQWLRANGCPWSCLLYTSDAADDLLCVDLGGRRIIKKKNQL